MPFPTYQGPTSFRTSLEEAEARCFAALATVTTDSVIGRNCWIGKSYQPIDSWTFQLTAPVPTDYHLLGEPDIVVLSYQAQAQAIFRERHMAQRWLMDITNALPLNEFGNIREFQIDTISSINYVEVVPPNTNKVYAGWQLTVSFIVIFLTGGRDFEEESSSSSSGE